MSSSGGGGEPFRARYLARKCQPDKRLKITPEVENNAAPEDAAGDAVLLLLLFSDKGIWRHYSLLGESV